MAAKASGLAEPDFEGGDPSIHERVGAYLAAVIWCDPNVSDCYSFALAKYLNNGQPDTTFGNNGIASCFLCF